MLKGMIHDTKGRIVKVDDKGTLVVGQVLYPITEQPISVFPIRQLLSLNGAGVTTDMRVDGSVTSQEFSIIANSETDLFITYIQFVLADAGAIFNLFGALTALTNGCLFEWKSPSRVTTLHSGIKSNFDLVQVCLGEPAFGAGADAFRGLNVVGTAEAYFPNYPLVKIVPPFGIWLPKGTINKIAFTIRDNLSVGLNRFDAIAIGFEKI